METQPTTRKNVHDGNPADHKKRQPGSAELMTCTAVTHRTISMTMVVLLALIIIFLTKTCPVGRRIQFSLGVHIPAKYPEYPAFLAQLRDPEIPADYPENPCTRNKSWYCSWSISSDLSSCPFKIDPALR